MNVNTSGGALGTATALSFGQEGRGAIDRRHSQYQPKTVETHRALALRKLNLDTTAVPIRYAIRNKLVEA